MSPEGQQDNLHNTHNRVFKSTATATTQPTETAMGRAFRRVVAALFFMRQKRMMPPLFPFFTQKHPEKGKETEAGNRNGRTEQAEGQDTGCRLKGIRFQPDRTMVSYFKNNCYSQPEMQLQTEGT